MTYLLDTSALLAHYFDEPGASEVDALWQDSDHRIVICVLTIPELKTRLRQEVDDADEVERVFELYANQLTTSAAVDRAAAEAANRLRESAASRIPLVDACIAGCAQRLGAVLVHRDPHFDTLAPGLMQLRLPDK